jgi:hypothetical protein
MAVFKTTQVVIPRHHHTSIVLRFILTSGRYLLSPPARLFPRQRTLGRTSS